MPSAVQITSNHATDQLDFDLTEVIEAVGDQSHLYWVLRNAQFLCDVTAVWPEGIAIEARTEEPSGLAISWTEMNLLGETCHQIIDGTFVGARATGEPELLMAAVDSSYWIVWAADSRLISAVTDSFRGVSRWDGPVDFS